MTKLNYDLMSEETIRKAVELLFNCNFDHETVKAVIEIQKQIKASQQTKKPVDMSVLVNSGVLCEFSESVEFKYSKIGFLKEINYARYKAGVCSDYQYCRPLYGHWHSAKNFDDVLSLISKLRKAGFEVVFHSGTKSFFIKGLQNDYCMPWEV